LQLYHGENKLIFNERKKVNGHKEDSKNQIWSPLPEGGYKCRLNLKVYQKLNLFVVLLNLHFLVVYDNSLRNKKAATYITRKTFQ
jgi:hypothetical protein